MNKTYLGDGLYAHDEGFQIGLTTPQGNEVYLDDQTLTAFLAFVAKVKKVKIEIKRTTPDQEQP